MKRIISLILIFVLLAGMLISCGEKTAGDTEVNSNTTDSADDQSGEQPGGGEGETKLKPNLPNEDFGGYKFTFVCSDFSASDDYVPGAPYEIVAELVDGKEVQNSEPINDAVYMRNVLIKTKYNFELELKIVESESDALKKAVNAGDSDYDAALMSMWNTPAIVTGNLLTNIAHLPYIDLNQPWWDPAVNAMSIDRRNFLLGGDLLILDNEATNTLLFNKGLLKDTGKELPYNLVTEGKWTMDKFNEYVKDTSFDINGDGKMSPYDDRWGFVCFNDTLHAFLVAGGGALALKDENDLPYMDFASERSLVVIEKAMDIMYNKNDVLNVQADLWGKWDQWGPVFYGSFEENRALFLWARMRVVERFRGMEADFGILPLPKFDENQADYRSVVNPYTGILLGVPQSADNLERVSIILEALAAESKYTLQPAYYDIVLQRKFARDEESSEMLDLIFNSRVYDIGGVYSFAGVSQNFVNLCNKSDRNVISFYDKNIGMMQKAIGKVVDIFQAMD